jgi:hypothetical protein
MISSGGLSEGPNLLQGDSPLCWHKLKPKSIQALIFSDSPAETSKSCSCSFNGGQKHQSTGQSVREQAVRHRSHRCGPNWGHQQRHWEDGWSFLGLPVSYVGNRLGGQSYEFCHPKLGLRGAGFRQVLDLDFFTSAEVMHFTKRASPGSFVLHGRQGSCCIMSHPVGRWREP